MFEFGEGEYTEAEVWYLIVTAWPKNLIGLIEYSYQQDILFFQVAHPKGISKLSVLG